MKKSTKYIPIAIAIIVAFILGYQFISKKGIFDDSIKLYLFASNVSDISTKSIVSYNGFIIGKVSDLNIVKGKVLIELSIDNGIQILKTAQFTSKSSSVMGDKQIEVMNSTEGDEFYNNGDTIPSEIIDLPSSPLIDSLTMKAIQPSLKEFSRTIGKALLEYGESGDSL